MQETEEVECKRQKRGSARDRGVVVQDKEEGQCKRQENDSAGKGEL